MVARVSVPAAAPRDPSQSHHDSARESVLAEAAAPRSRHHGDLLPNQALVLLVVHWQDYLQGLGIPRVISQIKKKSPTKFTFSPILSLFRQVGSLFRQALRSQVSGSPLESRPADRTASFGLCNLKLLSLSAQLERNAW